MGKLDLGFTKEKSRAVVTAARGVLLTASHHCIEKMAHCQSVLSIDEGTWPAAAMGVPWPVLPGCLGCCSIERGMPPIQ